LAGSGLFQPPRLPAPYRAAILQDQNPFKSDIFQKYGNKTTFSFGVDTISCGSFPALPGLANGALYGVIFWYLF
jgi:hypothetical protein